MAYPLYKKQRRVNKPIDIDSKSNAKKKVVLSKPLPIEKKELSKAHESLVKSALIIHKRQHDRLVNINPRTRNILQKHNEIMKHKSFAKVMDIINLIKFFN